MVAKVYQHLPQDDDYLLSVVGREVEPQSTDDAT
jgi:hypothetical protein